MPQPSLLVTLGDPRGIGPEVMIGATRAFLGDRDHIPPVVILGPDDISVAGLEGYGCEYHGVGPFDGSETSAGEVSLRAIRQATELALATPGSALVTGPVHKPALRAAGWAGPGQTELLQEITRASTVGMLMDAEQTSFGHPLRVLLATTHHPLREVPDRVTAELLVDQCRLLDGALRDAWRIAAPRIALCALNPHASDGGLFGGEEAEIYAPALRTLAASGVNAVGPVPADTVFSRTLAGEFDAVVAPYHDVGMAAFKTVSFGHGVNTTLGLPFLRTSPDHGTAFDLAGRGVARIDSALAALELAARLSLDRDDDVR